MDFCFSLWFMAHANIKWSYPGQWFPLKVVSLLHVLLMIFYTNFFLLLILIINKVLMSRNKSSGMEMNGSLNCKSHSYRCAAANLREAIAYISSQLSVMSSCLQPEISHTTKIARLPPHQTPQRDGC